VARYDAVLADHDHFFCEACRAVVDIEELPRTADLTRLGRDGYVVRTARVAVHGICPSCARTQAVATAPSPLRSARPGGSKDARRRGKTQPRA
jgi:hypothetical protein